MRKFLLLILAVGAISAELIAQRKLSVLFDYALFQTEEQVSYVEAYLKISPGTFRYKKNENGTFTGNVEIIIAGKASENTIDWWDRYKISTGEVSAADTAYTAVMDARRFITQLSPHRLELFITDLNSGETNTLEYADSLYFSFNDSKPYFSTPILVDRYNTSTSENAFTRSGYDIIPNLSGFVDGADTVLSYYMELYGTDRFLGEEEKYVLRQFIKNTETEVAVPGTESQMVSKSQKVHAALFSIPVKTLLPGTYSLVVELRNKKNEVVTTMERSFQRTGKINYKSVEDLSEVSTDFMALVESIDSLQEFIRCLDPITPALEQGFARNVLKGGDKEMMKRYIVSFWTRRNPIDPRMAWLKYKAQVQLVEKLFGAGFLRGYNTGRGRVFLMYGPPNVRSERPNEPAAWPYEIWQYYELQNPLNGRKQTNRRFVFWNRTNATNNYELLHSDATGEPHNERWEMVLYNRGGGSQDIDRTSPGMYPGGQSRDIFNNPR